MFTTAGAGAIPPAVFGECAVVERGVDALSGMHLREESVDLQSQDRLSGNYSHWFELSRRGLFTYDWRLHHGPYVRVSAPTLPSGIADADPVITVAAVLHRVPFSFADVVEIPVDEPVARKFAAKR